MKKPRLVLVNWEDAYSRQNWIDDDQIDEMFLDGEYQCTMVGYLIRNDKSGIVVAGRSNASYTTFGLLQRIPKAMVRKITTLR